MTNSTWGKIREIKSSAEDVFEGSLEKTTLYMDEFGDFTKNEFLVKSSLLNNLVRIGISVLLILILYVIVKYVSKQDYIENSDIKIKTETLAIILIIISCIRPVYFMIRNAELIKIDSNGIQILSDLIPWEDIEETYIERRSNSDSDVDYFLLIKSKNRNYRSSIEEDIENRKYISHIVETFRIKYGSAQQRV